MSLFSKFRHALEDDHMKNSDLFSKLDGTTRMTDILRKTISH